MAAGPSDDAISDEQARVYREQADGYDELVSAEDADGRLARALAELLPAGAALADVGGGTGRVTRIVAARLSRSIVIDREPAMLAVAERRLRQAAPQLPVELVVADARALPLPDDCVDASIAGWVFGHFRHWMPEGWRGEVESAVREMLRVTRPGGPVIVIETLGTGHEAPRAHPALDEYFARLEQLGFARTWLRTDYAFPDAATAARVVGAFFGEALAARVARDGLTRLPECTAVFTLRA